VKAGRRRLQEEMGFVTDVVDVFSFVYKAPFDNGLTEHEYDHVMTGKYENEPNINKEEAENYKWMTLENVKIDMEENPTIYTEWFKIIFDKSYKKLTDA
jgi:isopentenyl-diphosphate delta-isomerase